MTGYDLKNLIVGSEGTLGIVTAAWLRLLPAPEAALPVVAFYGSAEDGSAAIANVLGNGLVVSTLEYLDAGTLAAAGASFPGDVPAGAAFMVVAEVDGSPEEAARLLGEVVTVLEDGSVGVHVLEGPAAVGRLWRWRDGVSIAVSAQRGGKLSEDIAVPLDRLAEAIEQTVEIGRRHGLEALS